MNFMNWNLEKKMQTLDPSLILESERLVSNSKYTSLELQMV